ncbi:Amino acid ABC transporter substrate-binding protein [Rhodovastum atsumiense]|uniref:Amino acid ABC transporter substrate-binding protein n=1 Tax=Rhodovastum atsumiense TaxID=504468 RepID=A0A5M6J2H0_9PROT|nr:ABC transporter substrate-binding protein [Rhodovastum atsumiense]KAA5614721.1 amino acid ABC transporter substrate-binding protein [Rhodovastum atsumiense]CAH2599742.1 Amino acid ABC transporter substrate-binding protein [Rhodovastum atsumiense]
MIERRTMLVLGSAFAAGAAGRRAAAADEVKLFLNIELSGVGVASGSMFQRGVDLAVREINAAGGILGRRIALTTQDNQSQPQIAKAVAMRAVDQEPYAMLGPVYSGSINVTLPLIEEAEIPTFVAGEAAMLTQQGARYLFRTSFNQAVAMPKLAAHLQKSGVRSVAVVWIANDLGKGGRDAMVKELQARGIKVAADISTDPGQMDYSAAVVTAARAPADALFVYLNEEESARFLIALRKIGYDRPVYGESTLVGQRVLDLAGPAANGVRGHVGLSVDAPSPLVQAFGARFREAWGVTSDHNGLKGYIGVQLIKVVTERVGSFDRQRFARTLHGASFSASQYPGLLMDVAYDDKGDLDRESYLVEVRDGRQVITEVLPPLGRV